MMGVGAYLSGPSLVYRKGIRNGSLATRSVKNGMRRCGECQLATVTRRWRVISLPDRPRMLALEQR
jgi:hypothetical protein